MLRKLFFNGFVLSTVVVFLFTGCGAGGGSAGGRSGLTAPTVSSTSPANNATLVSINAAITATFSATMDVTSLTTNSFTLDNGITGTVTYSGTTATFTPSSNLAASKTYTATISTAAKDSSGNSMVSNYTWSFTTGTNPDTTPPTVAATSPVTNGTGAAVNGAITATFSEALSAATVTSSTFTLSNGSAVAGVVSYSGTTATFTPSSNLAYSSVYTATITAGVKDLAGNALTSNFIWTFTTGVAPDNTPPTVVSTSPANNATGVAVNSAINATFSEAMSASSISTATFTSNNGSVVTGAVTYAGTTATFTPSSPLSSGATYTIIITNGVKDLAGNAMTTNYSWSFKTISYNLWTWISGSNVINQIGVYGTQGVAAVNNLPGGRYGSVSWLDSNGSRWLFGGYGNDSAGTLGYMNDLWKYDGNNWIWVSGGNLVNQSGVYGTKGTGAVGNIPGARVQSNSWIDGSGNRWLFGGYGYDTAGTLGVLNDLWKYDGSNWIWVGGNNVVNQKGFYGTPGVISVGNIPGARQYAVSWIDASGNSWLFGGYGYDSAGTLGYMNDLWKFDGSNWVWFSGSNIANQAGVYGTQGFAAAGNIPGGRYGAVSWLDANGKLWVFGGLINSSGGLNYYNDLWKFDGSNWTWVSGSNIAGQTGTYGTQGVAAVSNTPGARYGAVGWGDASGKFWLFGGGAGFIASYNDLWQFDGSNWTWVSGSNVTGQTGTYGTQGVAAAGNTPGARGGGVSWGDGWLFGGAIGVGRFNDLWRYQP